MSDFGNAYDEILEDMQCPNCGCTGMMPNGSYEYECPNCGHQGSMLDE